MYKEDLALNNLQWLICHKTKLLDEWFVISLSNHCSTVDTLLKILVRHKVHNS